MTILYRSVHVGVELTDDGYFRSQLGVIVGISYKALTGDENSATDMSEFTRYMDSIIE